MDSDQVAYWNGEVGERWARNQARLDAMFAPLTQALLAAADLRPGDRVLDLGCGGGDTTLAAARAVGVQGRVCGIDVSAPLLAVAAHRAAARTDQAAPIEWIEGDAERYAFDPAGFDRALSRFGVMFFADSRAAFAQVRAALRPEATLTFLCWRAIAENPWVAIARAAVMPLLPEQEPASPDAPGPFRFSDRPRLDALLRQAGFREVSIEPVDRDLVLGRSPDGSARAAAEQAARVAAELGPVARLLRECEPELGRTALKAVAEALHPYARDGAVALGAGCWLVRARP